MPGEAQKANRSQSKVRCGSGNTKSIERCDEGEKKIILVGGRLKEKSTRDITHLPPFP